MLDKRTFEAEVWPHIQGRKTGEQLTPELASDWHYFCQRFTATRAKELIILFFRERSGKFFPKPGEFKDWLAANEIKSSVATSETKYFRYPNTSNVKDGRWKIRAVSKETGLSFYGLLIRCQGQHDNAYVFVWDEGFKRYRERPLGTGIEKFTLTVSEYEAPQEWMGAHGILHNSEGERQLKALAE